MYKAVSSEAALFQSDPFITFIFSTGGIILKPYIIKRILSAIPLLLIISFVCFVFINLIPSDPAEVALRVRQVPIITEDAIAEVRAQLGLDKPYLVRYFTWVLDCLHGDFGISYQEDVTVALASKDALPIKAIAAIIQHNTSGFVTYADKDIHSPKDFEGKTYAGWGGPGEEAVLKAVMTQAGADPSKLNRIISDGSGFEALKDKVDIEWFFEGWDNVKCKLNDFPINYMELRQLDERLDYYTPVIIANNDTLENRPELVKSFLAATEKGYKYAIENPDESAQILHKYAPDYSMDLLKTSQEYLAGKYMEDTDRWGEMKDSVWDNYTDFMTEYGVIDHAIPAADCYTNEFLPE